MYIYSERSPIVFSALTPNGVTFLEVGWWWFIFLENPAVTGTAVTEALWGKLG